MLPSSPSGLLRRAGALSVVLAGLAAAPAFADPDFCVSNPTSGCPSTVTADSRATTFAGLKAQLADHGSSGDEVIVEPGTYPAAVDLTGPTDLRIYGAPDQSRPVITSSGSNPTFSVGFNARGVRLTHLSIDHTGAPGPALATGADPMNNGGDFFLTDAAISSTGEGISDGPNGADNLTDVTVTSTAPAGTATATPLVRLRTMSSVYMTRVGVYADDRQTATRIDNASRMDLFDVYSSAHGLVAGQGGYGLFVACQDSGSDSRPKLTLSRSVVLGGSFGVGGFCINAAVDNTLLASDGDPVGPVKVGVSPSSTIPFGPAALASGARSSFDVRNLTAYAPAAGADGAVANSSRSNSDDDPFAYRSAIFSVNSIYRGGRKDLETSLPGGLDNNGVPFQSGGIGTSHDNFVTFAGGVGGDATDQTDDPMWVNPVIGAGGDFHVKAGSRTLGAGIIAGPADDQDLDHHARPDAAGGKPDLGAYESAALPAGPGTPNPAFLPPGDPGTGGGGSGGGGGNGGGGGGQPRPSNAFTVGGAKVAKTGAISLTLNAPATGAFAVKATTKLKVKVRKGKKRVTKTKTVTFATATKAVSGPSTVTLVLKPSAAAAAGLKGGRKEAVSVLIAFAPTGGTPATATKSVTVSKKR